MNRKIIRIIETLTELEESGFYNVAYGYSSEKQLLNIHVYRGKIKGYKLTVLEKSINLAKAQSCLGELFAQLENLLNYRPAEKTPVNELLPYFNVFESSRQIGFVYGNKRYTAMGRFKINDFVENMKMLSSEDADNTPQGYNHDDFYLAAEKQGAPDADIFRYEDRLVVPMNRRIDTFDIKNLKSRY